MKAKIDNNDHANVEPSPVQSGKVQRLLGVGILTLMTSTSLLNPLPTGYDIVHGVAKATQTMYMNLKAATAKGAVIATQQLIGAKVGHSAVPDAIAYASDQVMTEVMNGSTPPVTATPMAAVAFFPLVPGSIVITGVTTTPSGGAPTLETFVDQYYVGTNQPSPVPVTGTYTLLGTLGSTGSYNVATGVITLTVVAGGAFGGTAASINYRYSVEDSANANAVPGMDLEVVSENVDARVFDLRINYSVFAAKTRRSLSQDKACELGRNRTTCLVGA